MARHVAVALLFAVAVVSAALWARPGEAAPWAGLTNRAMLQVHEGDYVVTDDGAVVENLEIRGQLLIQASNVVVRNVWVYGSPVWLVKNEGSVTLENVEIGHPDHLGLGGIVGGDVVGRGLDIHHVEDGIKLSSNTLYENVYIHDLESPQEKPHTDAVQASGATSNVVVRNSILDSTGPDGVGNAAAIIKSDFGPISDVSITGSYLNGGNYTVYVRDGGFGMPTNVRFENNRIGPDRMFGLLSADGTVTWVNNVWDDTGENAGGNTGTPSATTVPGPATTLPSPSSTTPTTTAPTTTVPSQPSSTSPETTQPPPSTTAASTTVPTTVGEEDVVAAPAATGGRERLLPTGVILGVTAVLLIGLGVVAVRRGWIS